MTEEACVHPNIMVWLPVKVQIISYFWQGASKKVSYLIKFSAY